MYYYVQMHTYVLTSLKNSSFEYDGTTIEPLTIRCYSRLVNHRSLSYFQNG